MASITGDEAGAGTGRKTLALQADVSDTVQVQNFITSVFERFGTADILVNNAGLECRADFWDITEQDYDLVLNTLTAGVGVLADTQWQLN